MFYETLSDFIVFIESCSRIRFKNKLKFMYSACTLPPIFYIHLFIGITGAVEANY